MKISIVGAGSLGLLFGYYLADEHEVTYYIRNESQIDEMNSYGISLTGSSIIKQVKAKRITDYDSSDLLILALKQTQVPKFIQDNRSILKNQLMIFLQNGLEHIKYIEEYDLEAIIAVVEHGAQKVGHQNVNHLGKGVTKISPYDKLMKESTKKIEELKHETLNFIYFDDWKVISYEKLVVNAVINPLTALFNVSNGEVINNSHLKALGKILCKETSEILKLDFNEQWDNVKRVCSLTRKNTSSMRSDILSNQETEINAIIGYLLKQTGINYPYLEFVYQSIKALEERGAEDE